MDIEKMECLRLRRHRTMNSCTIGVYSNFMCLDVLPAPYILSASCPDLIPRNFSHYLNRETINISGLPADNFLPVDKGDRSSTMEDTCSLESTWSAFQVTNLG